MHKYNTLKIVKQATPGVIKGSRRHDTSMNEEIILYQQLFAISQFYLIFILLQFYESRKESNIKALTYNPLKRMYNVFITLIVSWCPTVCPSVTAFTTYCDEIALVFVFNIFDIICVEFFYFCDLIQKVVAPICLDRLSLKWIMEIFI